MRGGSSQALCWRGSRAALGSGDTKGMGSVQRVALWEHRNSTLISQVWAEEEGPGCCAPAGGAGLCGITRVGTEQHHTAQSPVL